jgi:NAD(P)-dependent dehydrogenase (short-subunit alcohol dehydrogenase family)
VGRDGLAAPPKPRLPLLTMESFQDKVCVITGGASGIGFALARRFQEAGMRVALGDIEKGALARSVDELGGESSGVLGHHCDVTRLDDLHSLRDAVIERFGGFHIVCLNAGVAPIGSIIGTSVQTWRWLVDVNVMGVVHGLDAFGPGLLTQGDGHFVLTASSAGLLSAPPSALMARPSTRWWALRPCCGTRSRSAASAFRFCAPD